MGKVEQAKLFMKLVWTIISNIVEYLYWVFKKATDQSACGFNRGLSSNFWWLKIANQVRFKEKCEMGKEKHILVKKKKMFTNGLRSGNTPVKKKL